MPYRADKIKIAGTVFDRRVKIPPEIHEEIIAKWVQGASQSELAKHYDVSRGCIRRIVAPEHVPPPSRSPGQYYDREKHVDDMRSRRRRKQLLVQSGALKLPEKEKTENENRNRH